MILGILSDTHYNRAMMQCAITALLQRGATYIIHCGDIGTAAMLDLFRVEQNKYVAGFVFGNDDENQSNCAALEHRAKEIGLHCYGWFGEFEMAGKKFAVLHGDDEKRLAEVISAGWHNFVLHGHTHVWRDGQVVADYGRMVRIINPGALNDPRPNNDGERLKTCAILRVDCGKLEKIILG